MFGKGSLNRVWAVLGAIEHLDNATVQAISEEMGFPRPSVADILKKLLDGQVPFVKVEKEGSLYRVVEWSEPREAIQRVFGSVKQEEK